MSMDNKSSLPSLQELDSSEFSFTKTSQVSLLRLLQERKGNYADQLEASFRKLCSQSVGTTFLEQHVQGSQLHHQATQGGAMKNMKVNKAQIRAALQKRYKKIITERILQYLDSLHFCATSLDIFQLLKFMDDLVAYSGLGGGNRMQELAF
mmetsp:Transcript_14958/g.14552  ORF Transcript_14958/g.14552 Transcript_14958/m.14552 type:complete len:151 (+) Transcript_14958:259-711(+)